MNFVWWNEFYSWTAWLVGIILQDKSLNKSVLKSWISWHNLYSLLINLLLLISGVSMEIAVVEKSSGKKDPTTSRIQGILAGILVLVCMVIMIFQRGYLWRNARKIGFSNHLESSSTLNYQNSYLLSNLELNAYSVISIIFTLIYAIGLEIHYVREGLLSRNVFNVFPFWLAVVITSVCVVIYSLFVFTTTGLLLMKIMRLFKAFDIMCDKLEIPCMELNPGVVADTKKILDLEDNKQAEQSSEKIFIHLSDLIWKVEDMKLIFREYDDLYNPIQFTLIVLNFLYGIVQADRIFDKTNSTLRSSLNILGAISNFMSVFFLIELGHRAHKLVSTTILTFEI